MSHKLAYEDAPEDNLKTWALLQKMTIWCSVMVAVILLGLYFAFIY